MRKINSKQLVTWVVLIGFFAVYWIFIHRNTYPQEKVTECSPKFEDYSVEVYKGSLADVDISTPEAHSFRTVLREAEKNGPNFAGNYTVAEWGGGTGVTYFAVMDATKGTVHFTDDEYQALYNDTQSSLGTQYKYQADSRLLRLGPPQDISKNEIEGTLQAAQEEKSGATNPADPRLINNLKINYFEFTDNAFKLICQQNYTQELKNSLKNSQ